MVEKEGAARVTCYVKDKAYVPHSMVKAPWSQCLVASGFVCTFGKKVRQQSLSRSL